MSKVLLTVFVTNRLRENVVDTLVALNECQGFTITKAEGYSREHAKYDLNEQVAGYRSVIKIDVLHNKEHSKCIIDALATIRSEHPMRYWLTPVFDEGVISC